MAKYTITRRGQKGAEFQTSHTTRGSRTAAQPRAPSVAARAQCRSCWGRQQQLNISRPAAHPVSHTGGTRTAFFQLRLVLCCVCVLVVLDGRSSSSEARRYPDMESRLVADGEPPLLLCPHSNNGQQSTRSAACTRCLAAAASTHCRTLEPPRLRRTIGVGMKRYSDICRTCRFKPVAPKIFVLRFTSVRGTWFSGLHVVS